MQKECVLRAGGAGPRPSTLTEGVTGAVEPESCRLGIPVRRHVTVTIVQDIPTYIF